MQKLVVDVLTGQETYIDLTAREETEVQARIAAAELERQAEEQVRTERQQAINRLKADPNLADVVKALGL